MAKDEHFLSRARQTLLRRIHQRYETKRVLWEIGGITFPFVQIVDPDQVLNEAAAEEGRLLRAGVQRDERAPLPLPYWAELWDSAVGMGQWLAKRQSEFARGSALDLGCGMGLAGTVAARLGMHVLFADLEPAALLFARLNSLPDAVRVRTRRLNWSTESLAERFDLIIGADILYERKDWNPLELFWRAHLKPGATLVLGEPGRQTGDLFVEWIGTRGWRLKQHVETVSTRPTPIRIFELQLA